MRKMVFKAGLTFPPYGPDHLRVIELRAGEDELEAVQRYMSHDPTLSNYVGLVDLPEAVWANRRFRLCWRHIGGRIAVDVSLARTQRLAEIRLDHDQRLEASDKDKARLDDVGTPEQIAAMKAYRQALRDLPATAQADIAALATPEQLDQYQPPWPVKP